MNKKVSRLRRAKRGRMKIQEQESVRLCVHRTPRHIYAQIIAPTGSSVLVSVSTIDKEVKTGLKYTGNVDAARIVGKLVAERAIKAGIRQVAFDRSGFQYHGRVKALADAAREGGLEF
ncbi:MAG: 50S ribosomal protein L18 [Gammaproteobacteria bacterium]|nr:50S ribosomal protein L18 [Gammaproteobacteria bacterium]